MKIVIATKNSHKLAEIQAIMSGLALEVQGLEKYPEMPEVIEDGSTFAENALKKARETFQITKTWTLADDSGLQVDFLKGAPGIYSARYAGAGATSEQLCEKLLSELKEVPAAERTARFNCTMALIDPLGREWVVEGLCEGSIGLNMTGEYGFGYDPVFLYKGEDRTLAQMLPAKKNKISHRAGALEKIVLILQDML
jgi:XTP/dITP diphosphohydrolase